MTGRGSVRGGLVALAAALTLLAAGCGGSTPAGTPSSSAPSSSGSSSAAVSGTITVLAAASLTDTFTAIGADVEKQYPGTKVQLSFGSSATLATSITNGAPADVFASASEATMKTVTDAGDADSPTVFVTNTLEIAVPKGNPGKITGLEDFADASKTIALCDETVPCGAAAKDVFAKAGITPKPDSYEVDVKAALNKVAMDEVDAALVYRTDVIAAGDDVQGIEFPEAAEVINRYPIAGLSGSKNPALAQAFVDAVLSEEGKAVLTKAGFGQP